MFDGLLNPAEARNSEQQEKMQELQELKICPFCPDHLTTHHREPILYRNDYWVVTKNDWPYEGSELHLLLIHRMHISSIEELSTASMIALGSAFGWIMRNLQIPGASFLMRFGDMEYNGATVSHLHAHIISGIAKNKGSASIKIKIGYKNNPPI